MKLYKNHFSSFVVGNPKFDSHLAGIFIYLTAKFFTPVRCPLVSKTFSLVLNLLIFETPGERQKTLPIDCYSDVSLFYFPTGPSSVYTRWISRTRCARVDHVRRRTSTGKSSEHTHSTLTRQMLALKLLTNCTPLFSF